MKKILFQSFGHALLVGLYVSLVAFIMTHAERWFGKTDTAFTPVAVLMLLVLSAAITGGLVVGRPALLYLDGLKKQALQFFCYTVAWLFVLTIIAFVILNATT